MAQRLCVAYGKLLEWAVEEPSRLPLITPSESVSRLPRPPPIPANTLVHEQFCMERCIRCMLPATLCTGRPCRPHGAQGHSLASLGDCDFCNRCGVYSFSQLCLLGAVCRGRPIGNGSAWRLDRMRAGRHPKQGHFVGQPKRIDTSLGAFEVLLGEVPRVCLLCCATASWFVFPAGFQGQ